MAGALVYNSSTNSLVNGNAGFSLSNLKYTRGSGANLKFGLIVRPVEDAASWCGNPYSDMAFSDPYWLREIDFNYTPDNAGGKTDSGNEYTDNYDYDSRLSSPWRFMVGASAVLGSQAIPALTTSVWLTAICR